MEEEEEARERELDNPKATLRHAETKTRPRINLRGLSNQFDWPRGERISSINSSTSYSSSEWHSVRMEQNHEGQTRFGLRIQLDERKEKRKSEFLEINRLSIWSRLGFQL